MSSYYNPTLPLRPIYNQTTFKHSSLLPFREVRNLYPYDLSMLVLYNSPFITIYANNVAIGSLSASGGLVLPKLNVNRIYFYDTTYTSTYYSVLKRTTTDIGTKRGFKINTFAVEDGMYFGGTSTIGDLNLTRLFLRCNGSSISEIQNPNGNLKINRHGIQFGGINTGPQETNSAQISSGIHRANYMNIKGASTGTLNSTSRVAFIADNVEIINDGKITFSNSNIQFGPQYGSLNIQTYSITTSFNAYTFALPSGYTYTSGDYIDLQVLSPANTGRVVYQFAGVSGSTATFNISTTSARNIDFRLVIIKWY